MTEPKRYILTEPLTIPPGTIFTESDAFGGGGLEAMDDRLCMRVFIGRALALEQGVTVPARPARPSFLRLVDCDNGAAS